MPIRVFELMLGIVSSGTDTKREICPTNIIGTKMIHISIELECKEQEHVKCWQCDNQRNNFKMLLDFVSVNFTHSICPLSSLKWGRLDVSVIYLFVYIC